MSLSQLDLEERLRLMKFVCSFAWADLEIQDEERTMVGKMILSPLLGDDLVSVGTRGDHGSDPSVLDVQAH